MSEKLTDRRIRCLAKPAKGCKVYYDTAVKGLGVSVTPAGTRSFILNYTVHGRERRITLGRYPAWSIAAARDQANKLRLQIDNGDDPLRQREDNRGAWTVRDLFNEYKTKHVPTLAPRSQGDVLVMWERYILPSLASEKLANLTAQDIDTLHHKITQQAKPVRANRILEVLRHALNLAVRWGKIDRNPAIGFVRNPERPKENYLTMAQVEALLVAVDLMENQKAANVIRLLIYTGARLGEVLNADWSQFDLERGVWTKPSSHTKQRRIHRVPLSNTAWELLKRMQRGTNSPFLFPNQTGEKPIPDINKPWRWLQKKTGFLTLRIHDLRHTFASLLISEGESLPIIGKLLGHSQHQTTLRYAHLMDDPLRKAVNAIGGKIR